MAADTNPINMSTLIGACFAGTALLVLNGLAGPKLHIRASERTKADQFNGSIEQ